SRRRHTRSTRDWSSDVCSSDLRRAHLDPKHRPPILHPKMKRLLMFARRFCVLSLLSFLPSAAAIAAEPRVVYLWPAGSPTLQGRSEERRVGKGGRVRWSRSL